MLRDGTLAMRRATIARRLHLGERTVDRLVADLRRLGYLVQTGEQGPGVPARYVATNPAALLLATDRTRATPRRVSESESDGAMAREQTPSVALVDSSDQEEQASRAYGRVLPAQTGTANDRRDSTEKTTATTGSDRPLSTTTNQQPRVTAHPGTSRVLNATTEGSGSKSSARDLAREVARNAAGRRGREPGPGQIPLLPVMPIPALPGAVDVPVTDDAPTVQMRVVHPPVADQGRRAAGG